MTPTPRSDVPAARPMVSMLGCLGVVALLPVLGGCPAPDAEGKYDAFLDQTEEEREDAANIKMDQGGSLADVNGTFLLALAAVIDPEHPLQFYTTSTFTPGAEGGTLALDLQPLSLEVLSTTTPRLPVGDPLVLPAAPVDASGGFMITIAEPVMVTGEANPITGSDIVATLVLTGSIQSEDLFCGTVTGAVTSPLMLDLVGSTFAAVRVPSVDMLPAEVTSACPAGGGGESGGTGAGTSDGSGSDSGG
jgi:hypothetical protein